VKYVEDGYTNIKALDGGVAAWKEKGFAFEE
jgi:rhodanese-related sulfurtransferase